MVNALGGIGLLVFEVGGDEGLAPSDFSALSFFAGSVVAHLTQRIVGVVGSVAVRAGDGMLADSEALLPVFLIHVGLLALLAGLVVVVFWVSSSASSASDRAVGVGFVSEFPTAGTLDEVDFFYPLGAEAGSVEEEEGRASEFLEVGLIRVRDTEANVATGCVWDAVTVGPGWSFYEHGISKYGVGLADLFLELCVSDRHELSGRGSKVFIDWGVLVSHPSLGGDVSYDDSGPLGGLDEQTFGGSLGEDSEDGVTGLFDLGVDRVVGEENGEVHCGSPFCRVGLDVELTAGTVDLANDSLDGHGRSGEGFLVLVEFDHIPFTIVAGALRLLFGHGAHEPSGGNIIVFGLRSSDLWFGSGGSGGEGDLFWLTGSTGRRSSSGGFSPRVFHFEGRGFDRALFPFGFWGFFRSVTAFGSACELGCGDSSGWVDGCLSGV